MNLSFDLQLFATTSLTIMSGISGGSREYTIQDVKLSGNFSTGPSAYANFKADSTATKGFTGVYAGAMDSASVLAFGGASDASATVAGLFGSGGYTWNFASSTISNVSLGKSAKLNIISAKNNQIDVTLNAYAGQQISFDGNPVELALSTNETADTLGSYVALKNGKGDVSLLSGSSLTGASVTGAPGEAITLSSKDKNIFNLKGSDSEALVTIGGAGSSTVHSASLVGFKKITFNAGNAAPGAEVSLDGIKDSAVSILGGKSGDTIVIGENVSRSSVSINGAKGEDSVTLSGTGAELLIMNNGTVSGGGDTVNGWISTDGDIEKGNTLKIDGLMSTFYVKEVTGTQAVIGQGEDSTAALTDKIATTLVSANTSAGANYGFGVNVVASDDTYSALLVGKDALTSVQGIRFDNYSYVIADKNQTLDLGKTNKKVVVLANSVDEKHWDDTNVYQNVVTVASSSVGKSKIIGGVANESLTASLIGSNDSIWGANNLVGDAIYLTAKKDQVVFSGANDGLDSIIGYKFGDSASKANAVRFLDGINYISAGDGTLTLGADESNAVEVQLGNTVAVSVAYGFGLEGDKYVAGVDATKDGTGKIAYGSDVSVYIGQGDGSTISIDSSAKDVKLGWDGGAGYVSIGAIDGSMAADGAVIIGTTDNAQTITGSSRGASSISGGFVADEWTDGNADVLTGGGVATKSTTFFVGENMGKDEIYNLSSKDNIVFLGSKYEDLVKFAPEATDSGFTFKFANNNVIEATAVGSKLSAVKDVSLYFDDGTYVWNGSELTKAE